MLCAERQVTGEKITQKWKKTYEKMQENCSQKE